MSKGGWCLWMSKSGGVFQFFGGWMTSRGQCPRGVCLWMFKSGGVFQFFGGRMTSRGQCPRGLHPPPPSRNPLSAPEMDHPPFKNPGSAPEYTLRLQQNWAGSGSSTILKIWSDITLLGFTFILPTYFNLLILLHLIHYTLFNFIFTLYLLTACWVILLLLKNAWKVLSLHTKWG